MKTFLGILLASLIFQLNAQTLTIGQVYNFDVGDVIGSIYSGSGTSGPPMYKKSTILAKVISVNNDTITYTISEYDYTPPACQNCSASISSNTVTKAYTNLNSPITQNNGTTCLATDDTLYYAYCNRKTYEVHPVSGNNCFEPITVTSKHVEGVGGPFFTKYVPFNQVTQTVMLDYYMKQAGNCPVDLFIDEGASTLPVSKIYPVPANDLIHFECAEQVQRYDIFDLTGNISLTGFLNENQVNTGSLKSGVYILHLWSADGRVKTARIIKE